jgi:hypothetical protein
MGERLTPTQPELIHPTDNRYNNKVRTAIAGIVAIASGPGALFGVAGASETGHNAQETCTTDQGVTSCVEVARSVSKEANSISESVHTIASSNQAFFVDTHWTTKSEQAKASAQGNCHWYPGSEVWDGGWYDGKHHSLIYKKEPNAAKVEGCTVPFVDVPVEYRSIAKQAELPNGEIIVKVGEINGLDERYGIAETDCGNPLIISRKQPKNARTAPNAIELSSVNEEGKYIAVARDNISVKAVSQARVSVKSPNGTCNAEASAFGTAEGSASAVGIAISSSESAARIKAKADMYSQRQRESELAINRAESSASGHAISTAEAQASCSSSKSTTPPPQVSKAQPTCNGLSVSVNGDEVVIDEPSFTLNGAQLEGFDINFGNGTSSNYQPNNFPLQDTYTQAGQYTISASLLTNHGDVSSANCQAKVEIAPPPTPTPTPPPTTPITIQEVPLTTAEALYTNSTEQLCVATSASDGSQPSVEWSVVSGEGQVTASYEDQDGNPNHQCTTYSGNPNVGLSIVDATATDGNATPVTVQFQIATQQSSGF